MSISFTRCVFVMSKAVTFEMPDRLRDQLKSQARQSGLSFKDYTNAILEDAAAKNVLVQFKLVESKELPMAANFSDRSETPEIDD